MLTHKRVAVETVTALMHDAPLMFVVGVMALVAGLAMVLAHNVWSGGALPVVVTLVGWGILVKSVLLLLLSPEGAVGFFLGRLHYAELFYLYVGFSGVIGAYLTMEGFRAKSH